MGPVHKGGILTIKSDCRPVLSSIYVELRLGGGPTAIRTRVTSSASSCDIQATLWVQYASHLRIWYNVDGDQRLSGSSVFHLDSANFLAFGPVLGFGFL